VTDPASRSRCLTRDMPVTRRPGNRTTRKWLQRLCRRRARAGPRPSGVAATLSLGLSRGAGAARAVYEVVTYPMQTGRHITGTLALSSSCQLHTTSMIGAGRGPLAP
jgi:hypothetical protein